MCTHFGWPHGATRTLRGWVHPNAASVYGGSILLTAALDTGKWPAKRWCC
jgi:hypothetical protein